MIKRRRKQKGREKRPTGGLQKGKEQEEYNEVGKII